MITTDSRNDLTTEQARDLMIYLITSGLPDGSMGFFDAAAVALSDIRTRDSILWHAANGEPGIASNVAAIAIAAADATDDDRERGHCLAVASVTLSLANCERNAAAFASQSAVLGNLLGLRAYLASKVGLIHESFTEAMSRLSWSQVRYGIN